MNKRSRGYTVVELMMALAVFTAGVTGIITMQRTAIGANRAAKNVALASSIAQAWQAQLAADATRWGTSVTGTTWLKEVDTAGMNGAWQRLAADPDLEFSPWFDALGNPVDDADDGQFCSHVRLTWLYRDGNGGGTPGNGVIRTEVRVFWPREGATRIANDCSAAAAAQLTAIAAATDRYHFVTQVGAVRQP